jgi:hypothetical protein
MRKQSLISLTMSRFTIENNEADVLKGKEHVHHNGVDTEDNVFLDDSFVDEYGRFDLFQALPNGDDNPVKYLYTRDHTGRVVSVVRHLKVPKEQVHTEESRNKDGDCARQIEKIAYRKTRTKLEPKETTRTRSQPSTTRTKNKHKKENTSKYYIVGIYIT